MPNRRNALKNIALASSVIAIAPEWSFATGGTKSTPRIACQQYPWTTFYKREQKDWHADLEASFSDFAGSGFKGFEPGFETVEQVRAAYRQLEKQKLWTSSLYVNSVLHDPDLVEASMKDALAIAAAAKRMEVQVVVTNPSPIRWGGPENKSDEQLMVQAKALNELGSRLRSMGLVLAYHNHDAEMREGAREFHHMMVGTDPENVKLCLDSHWIYRGAGNSQLAIFDIVKLYGDRIVELHLRQSREGIWTESFGPGDIDYERLAETLLSKDIRPLLVMEQAVEEGSPHTMDAATAHKASLAYAQEVFAGFG